MNDNVLSIENLFPSCGARKYGNGRIDTDLFNGKTNDELNFDSDILLQKIINKRKKIRELHVKYFNICCKKIESADSVGMTDIIFKLPKMIEEINDFDFKDCIEYISKNLKRQKLDTYIINKRTLFVSWKYIELNKYGNKDDSSSDSS
uniref:Uncharacterized protein n=1 Tax=viral metagenome TaxID=1070528 RepID=A0A6C0EBI7_9ZZZZ